MRPGSGRGRDRQRALQRARGARARSSPHARAHRRRYRLTGEAMATANVRGVKIHYEVFGTSGPWVALTTGGRRDLSEFTGLAQRLAAEGFRVVLHDRRNTGASDIVIDGDEGEEAIWADDLYELLGQLGARPAFIGGASSGSRTSLLFYLRHPEAVRALMLMQVT